MNELSVDELLSKHCIGSMTGEPVENRSVSVAHIVESGKRHFTRGDVEDTGDVGSHRLTVDAKKQILELYADGLSALEISTICKLHVSVCESVIEEGATSNASLADQMLRQLRTNEPAVTDTSLTGNEEVVAGLSRKLSKVMNGQ